MSRDVDGTADFERQLHALLAEGVQRVGGRARSRLNQARHAAISEATRTRRWYLPYRLAVRAGRPGVWMPAAGALAAAVLVAFVLWPQAPQAPQAYPTVEASHAEDLDLIADRDGVELMQGGDGQFYEWAMAQADQGGPPADPAAAAPDKSHGSTGADGQADQNSG